MKPLFITLEGNDGCGKSTIAKLLVKKLEKDGFPILLTREPGGVKIAEDIRNILLDKENTNLDDRTEALLFASSRRQHLVEKILPALEKGISVISDRYIDSSLAYQGGGKNLGVDKVLEINLFATENKLPDLTILFDVKPEIGLERIAKSKSREVNRLDLETITFYHKVQDTYNELAKKYSSRYVVIDASQDIEHVLEDAYQAVIKKLKE